MRTSTSRELLFCRGHHARWLKAELLLQFFEGSRSAERLHADHVAAGADVTLPSKRGPLFDGDSRRHRRRQYALAVLRRLIVEQLPGRHADDSTSDSLLAQSLMSGGAQRDLAAGGDQQDLGVATRRFRKNVGAFRQS